MHDLIARLDGQLVVSCQAYPGEPMRDPNTMCQIAQACVAGGAGGIRAQGIDDIAVIAETVDVPVTGLWKDGTAGVFITPTLRHALAVANAGADIVAVDGTRRPRPDDRTLTEVVAELKKAFPDIVVMADCGSTDDARAAEAAGVDVLGTTLAGYTLERPKTDGPDLALIEEIAQACRLPVVAEGRIHSPEQAASARRAGAYAVCVGTAITHPSTLTGWYRSAVTLPRSTRSAER